MNAYLPYLTGIPLVGLLLIIFAKNEHEKYISGVVTTTITVHLILLLVLMIWWFTAGQPAVLFQHGPVLYKTEHSDFSLDFFMDLNAFVYLMVAVLLTLLVSVFSKYYMHREKGYKRFFLNILFFLTGLQVILIAGNFETMFIGWEIIGATSFFLITFYRERYLPVKNGLKVVSFYRIADIALLCGIWISHHYFSKNILFIELHQSELSQSNLIGDYTHSWLIPGLFLIAAMVKSAQFPFSHWLPRAMEGPTTSTSIFYGSLSVHIGAFLLMRTWPLWHHHTGFVILVTLIGLATCITSSAMAQVQSSIKTQIAYSSVAQIGIIWVEIALGLHWLALIHFAGNAFLRSYQLLVSPAVLSYRIHDQFFYPNPPAVFQRKGLLNRLKTSLYILSLREWRLDNLFYNYVWMPLKRIGNRLGFFSQKIMIVILFAFYFTGLYLTNYQELLPPSVYHKLPVVLAVLSLLIIIRAFTERSSAFIAWTLIFISQLFTSLSITYNEQFDTSQVVLYLSGILISAALGYLVLLKLSKHGKNTKLNTFNGHSYEHPRLAFLFAIASLGMAGFPITPSFIGEDFIIGHIHENQVALIMQTALCLILDGIVVFRIYARLFLGPHEQGYHEVAYRSS